VSLYVGASSTEICSLSKIVCKMVMFLYNVMPRFKKKYHVSCISSLFVTTDHHVLFLIIANDSLQTTHIFSSRITTEHRPLFLCHHYCRHQRPAHPWLSSIVVRYTTATPIFGIILYTLAGVGRVMFLLQRAHNSGGVRLSASLSFSRSTPLHSLVV
jgi:hypothetical protein